MFNSKFCSGRYVPNLLFKLIRRSGETKVVSIKEVWLSPQKLFCSVRLKWKMIF